MDPAQKYSASAFLFAAAAADLAAAAAADLAAAAAADLSTFAELLGLGSAAGFKFFGPRCNFAKCACIVRPGGKTIAAATGCGAGP